jgi:hypothetical protein
MTSASADQPKQKRPKQDGVQTAEMASGNPSEVAAPLIREDRAKARADSRNSASPPMDRAEAARRYRMRQR